MGCGVVGSDVGVYDGARVGLYVGEGVGEKVRVGAGVGGTVGASASLRMTFMKPPPREFPESSSV